jgi:tetratricopeptide (TPR) repeat protein
MKTHVNLFLTAAFLILFSGGCFSSAKSTAIDSSGDASFGFEAEVVEDYSMMQGTPSQQDPECIKYRSLYGEEYRQRNFEMAWPSWKYMYENCPDFTENLYIHGVTMARYFIEKETDPVKRDEMIDFMLGIYDQRIKYYGNEGLNLSRKAVELRTYRPDEYMEQFEITERSILVDNISASLNALIMNLESVIRLAIESQTEEIKAKFTEEKILQKFDRAMDIIQENLKNLPGNLEELAAARTSLENLFLPFATCDNLIKIYGPRFDEAPNDPDLLNKITAFLMRSDCTDSELYFKATRNLHRLNPSAQSAYNMGRMEEANENFTEAIGYYDQALEMSNGDNGIDKYLALIRIANMYDNMGRYSQARSYALRAAEERPNCGRPWIMIANMYARSASSCGSDEISTAAVYWAATDKAQRARSVDNDPDVVSAANRMISSYSARFPDRERLFMLNLDGGQTVRVGCWIGESTVARPRP